jgi:AcrR family transcriptional regulator
MSTLVDRQVDLTRKLLLEAAVDLLETGGVPELTMRAVAKRANISERTVFRYFTTRDEFLDSVAAEARASMALPPPPRSVEELFEAPRRLYEALEAKQRLVVACLHSELHPRVREEAARTRWVAIRKIIDEFAGKRDARARKIAATNICYVLGATSWHFYRFNFRLGLDDAIACAETTIRLATESLRK